MRVIPAVLGVVLLGGCAGGNLPNRFSGPAGGGQALTCVTERLGSLGYQSVGGAAGSGLVRLERVNDEPWWLQVLGFNDSVDVVDATTQGGQLQVTVYSQVVQGGERSAAAPDPDARAQAREAFTSCST
jgi:hypothetical protein